MALVTHPSSVFVIAAALKTLALTPGQALAQSSNALDSCPNSNLVCETGTHRVCQIPKELPVIFAEEYCVLDSNPAKKQGPYRMFYRNINSPVIDTMIFVNGVPNGLAVQYHENGQVREIGQLKNDYRVGTWESFTEEGVRIKEAHYDDKSRGIGTWTRWRKDGTIENIQVYENLTMLYSQSFNEKGILERETFDTPEHPTGEFRVFDETGTIVVRSGFFPGGGQVTLDNPPKQNLMSVEYRNRKLPTPDPSPSPSITPVPSPSPSPSENPVDVLANHPKIKKDLGAARCQHIKFMQIGETLVQKIQTDPLLSELNVELNDISPSQLVEWLVEPKKSELYGRLKWLPQTSQTFLRILAAEIRQDYYDQTRVWIPTADKERHIRFGYIDGFSAENEIKSYSRITGKGMELPWPAILDLSLKAWSNQDPNTQLSQLGELKCRIGDDYANAKILGLDSMGFLNPTEREHFYKTQCTK